MQLGRIMTKKLNESISTNEMKIIELYNKIDNDLLNTHPDYQRKLVWKKQHKYAFIDTILKNYPFPEVYLASSEIDIENMISKDVVVDGQQRLTTIVEYIKSDGDFKNQKKILSFNELSSVEKKEFLNYKVSVKDLKDIGEELIKEIFQRINSTEYSLNIIEKNNAQFGDGEVAIFCKQLIDTEFEATEDNTDILLKISDRKKIFNFFNDNGVFTNNDIKRMFDFQYIMLFISTFLEGEYYGRSAKVDVYLEKYNSSFEEYQNIIDVLLNSINIILQLGFSKKSYWYNKANLFTLLIELSKVDFDEIDLVKLEEELLTLEDKVDLYFNADSEDDIEEIDDDVRKYFEVARHGSHEKSAREHRGKVISKLIEVCKLSSKETNSEILQKNIEYFQSNNIVFAPITPTKTGLGKNIMDAVIKVREFLKANDFHDYESQQFGPDHKVKINCKFIMKDKINDEYISLYRSNGRGDYRIWFTNLGGFVNANDALALIKKDKIINVLNLSRFDYTSLEF